MFNVHDPELFAKLKARSAVDERGCAEAMAERARIAERALEMLKGYEDRPVEQQQWITVATFTAGGSSTGGW